MLLKRRYQSRKNNAGFRGRTVRNALRVHSARLDRLEASWRALFATRTVLWPPLTFGAARATLVAPAATHCVPFCDLPEPSDDLDDFLIERIFPRLITAEEKEAGAAAAEQERQLFLPWCPILAFSDLRCCTLFLR